MHRFYLPPEHTQGGTLILEEREAHHALHVLRIQRGQTVTILNGVGEQIACQVQEAGRRSLILTVRERKSVPRSPWQLTLLQAIPKGKTMEIIIEKATELGVYRIVPLLAERSAVRLEDGVAGAKTEKWRTTALESIKQCGSPWLPIIEPPSLPRAFLGRSEPFELSLVASLQNDAKHPRIYFQSFYLEHQRPPRTVGIWVGPEGDFTPAELDALKAAGTQPISLGRLVLRSETAALYCLSILNYELQAPS